MLADEIKQFFRGEVSADDDARTKYSRDYSLFKVMPQVVVFPKDAEDLERLVQFVAEKKAKGEDVSLTGRSAGTDMTGGPLTQGIVVSFTEHFHRVKEIAEAEGGREAYVVTEPGVYFRDLEPMLTAKGLLYPPFPASKDLCALGGMVNNNSGGEKTLAYGKTEHYVRELTLVMADGKTHTFRPLAGEALAAKLAEEGFEGDLYRGIKKLIDDHYDAIVKAKPDVSKNSAGYFLWNVWNKETGVFDLTRLIVGSQGTFGLLTEAKLGLVPLKKHSRMAVIFLRDLGPVGDLVNELLKFAPESIESYDDKTLEIAVKFWRALVASMKGSIFTLGWQFIPEMFMVLRGGMPKMIMLVELTGDNPAALDASIGTLADAVRRFAASHAGIQVRALRSEKEEEKYWAIRRQSFAMLHNNTTGKDTAPFIDDFIVKPEYLPEILPKVNAILDRYKDQLVYTIAGHPGNGNFHIIPLMDLKDPKVRALIPAISEEVYQLVLKYRGSITAEHNDGIIRTPYLGEMYGKEIEALFAATKKIFDPLGIFNPGKKVGGTLAYSEAHIEATQ